MPTTRIRAFALAGPIAFAFVVGACGGSGNIAQPTPPATVPTASGGRTGIVDLDTIIDATLRDDAPALRNLIKFTSKPCTFKSDDITLPQCRPQEAAGTPVGSIAETVSGSCGVAEGTMQRRPDEITTDGSPFPGVRLYAVYRSASSSGGDAYVAVFVNDPGDSHSAVLGASLHVENGRIVAIDVHCGPTAQELVDQVASADFLIRP